MTGAGAVLTLVLVEWTGGLLLAAGWTESWNVVTRGHFRIIAWTAIALGIGAFFSFRATGAASGTIAIVALIAFAVLFLAAQYVRSDQVGHVIGVAGGIVGAVALAILGSLSDVWDPWLISVGLIVGMLLVGGVGNGMLLGHWYLNQPGLKPFALERLTNLTLVAVVLSTVFGLVCYGPLTSARTEGAVLGLPGFGESFSFAFYVAWLVILAFTGGVVWAARRCVKIRSIQSATGLFYVALLTAGVAEFLVRYLMVNA
ncbi:MAG TPA: hypothetical protein VFK89_07725 [Actinomycetota bacterium]|nr:hypothetical protein [Actinomycetota bacterium]